MKLDRATLLLKMFDLWGDPIGSRNYSQAWLAYSSNEDELKIHVYDGLWISLEINSAKSRLFLVEPSKIDGSFPRKLFEHNPKPSIDFIAASIIHMWSAYEN